MHKLSALVFVLFAWYPTAAQPSQSAFLHYTTDQGLSNDHITAIAKDKRGFLWISTVNGLNRFDGRSFKIFHHEPDNVSSIPNDHITDIAVAPDGWLWIATYGGLCKLDPYRLEIFRIVMPENKDDLNNDAVTNVAFDSKGKIWTTGNNGIYQINPTTGKIEFFYKTKNPTLGWYGLVIDDRDRLWLLKDSLRRFDPLTQSIKCFNGIHPKESLFQAGCLSLVQDPAGKLWAGTWGGGVWEYKENLDEFVKRPIKLSLAVNLLPDQSASGNQFIWIGGGNTGLGIYYPDKEEFVEFKPDVEDPFTHNNYLATTFFKDNPGEDVWIGTEVGLEHYAPSTIRFGRAMIPAEKDMNQFSLVSGVVHDNTDPSGQRYFISLWGYGLYEWNKSTGKFLRMQSSHSSMTGGGNFNLMQDRNGILWACMNDGIGRYNPRTQEWRDYKNFFKHNDRNNLFWCAHEDQKGNLWFGSNREGLFHYNPQTDRIENIFYQEKYADENGYLNIMGISEDSVGRLWLASNSSSLIRLNPVTGELKQFFYPGQNITLKCNDVEAGMNGHIYAAFYDKFLVIDQEGNLLHQYDQQNGLKSNRIHFIIEDLKGKIWFNSIYQLHRFDPLTGNFQYYGKPDGLFSNIMTDALCITPRGEMFVGFQNAFNFFYPDQLRRNIQPPPVAITSIKVMNKKRDVTTQAGSDPDTFLLLEPGEDFFEVEFAALNYNQQERNQYAYILEGFNKDWIQTDRPVATFTNLDGGEYLLRMKASNNDGIWNETGTSLKIIVHPPFYKTQWFFILILLAMGALAIGLLWFRRHQRKRLEIFREALARDLHDEMGSTLSSIRFFSEYATGQIGTEKPQVTPVLHRISQSATDLSESMQDIIWAMKTQNDQLDDLATHMVEFGLRLLEAKDVKFKAHISSDFSGKHLKPEVRRNIYLIFKEAVNNAAKYSEASVVELFCNVKKNMLIMHIHDNGKGFDVNELQVSGGGNGMQNMHQRAKAIGGILSIHSSSSEGTTLELKVPI